MRTWLDADTIGPLANYLTETVSWSGASDSILKLTISKEKETHRSIFQDNYGPATNWHHAYMGNLNEEDERASNLDPTLGHPVLMITASRDIVATAAMMERGIRKFSKDVRVKELDTGHWVQLEGRDDVNKYLEEFYSN